MKVEDDIMRTAEKILYEEFAVALKLSPDDVVSFIMDHVHN